MRSLAVKIFLGFWLIHALIFVVLGLLPDTGGQARFAADTRFEGRVAAGLLEQDGPPACSRFVEVLAAQKGIRLAVYDADRQLVCPLSIGADSLPDPRVLDWPDGHAEADGGRRVAVARLEPAEGAHRDAYTVVGSVVPGPRRRPDTRPVPWNLLVTAVLVSGVVCFLLARYVAYPLGRMRHATRRLAAGDLSARAGTAFGTRRDEVGDLVRDFDAMADRISSLVQAQGRLLSDISHELRSPLARLNVALELARRKSGPAAVPDLDRIEAEAERMNELIGQVLALSRAERDEGATQAATSEPVDIDALVRDVAEDADYEARQHGKSVTLRADVPAEVAGDPELLRSAVENVVRNAVRYTAEATAVEITVTRDAGAVTITVCDRGPGVPEAELEQIFAPFHRVGSARTRASGGTGLGLAIARRAVAVHGGTIAARNDASGGLAVTIRLPLR